jgi:hypothetical protein
MKILSLYTLLYATFWFMFMLDEKFSHKFEIWWSKSLFFRFSTRVFFFFFILGRRDLKVVGF